MEKSLQKVDVYQDEHNRTHILIGGKEVAPFVREFCLEQEGGEPAKLTLCVTRPVEFHGEAEVDAVNADVLYLQMENLPADEYVTLFKIMWENVKKYHPFLAYEVWAEIGGTK